jgi:hypothetical protein
MKKRLLTRMALLLVLAGVSSCGKQQPTQAGMPIYVTPYYNSDGLQIHVGKYSAVIAGMTAANAAETQKALQADWAELSPEAMYVLAIRLYDLGWKDDAVYWFYSAQYRARLFQGILDPAKVGGLGSAAFERKQAYIAFHQLSGEYINGYAFGDPAKLAGTVSTVQSEGKTLPSLQAIFPNVVFVNEAGWSRVNEGVNVGLNSFLEYLKNNAEEIKAQRKSAGMEGKY